MYCVLQVIFLDSDNIAMVNPSSLLQSKGYLDTGALLWPDYWASSAAPDLQRILPDMALPLGTYESGQMVFDKQRWVCVRLFSDHECYLTCMLCPACSHCVAVFTVACHSGHWS